MLSDGANVESSSLATSLRELSLLADQLLTGLQRLTSEHADCEMEQPFNESVRAQRAGLLTRSNTTSSEVSVRTISKSSSDEVPKLGGLL